MNRIYRHIWSKAFGRLIVVPECAKGGLGKKSGRRRRLTGLTASALLAGPALAGDLPGGGTVVSGSATITTSGTTMTVNQSSDKMIANWQSFSIGTGNSVTFNQPTSSSVALNRIVGQDASQILGNLTANGQVFLVNPNGVVIGQGAQVKTGGFVASTLGISDEDFLSENYAFTGSGGSIVNKGEVSGNVVALIAPSVTNEGTITGDAALAAGTDVLLDFDGDGLISVEVKASTMETLVENKGLIKADGGKAILTAKGASDAMKGVVNNSGTIQARTIAKKNGRILLLGDMDNGEVNVSGKLDASAPSAGDGGFIETSAAKVKVSDSAKITTKAASGATGTWLIDPNDYTIAASGGDITGTSLSSMLSGTNVAIESADGATSGNDDIFVNDSVTWSANTLTLSAYRNIEINAVLHGSGTAGLALEYGQGAIASGNDATYSMNAAVNLASTGSFSTKLGSDGATISYTIITDIDALQAISVDLSGNYVLGSDIDASETASWNSGAGFDPLGDVTTGYSGMFDGLGHVITGLTIDRSSESYVGLFGSALGATIRNIGLEDVDMTGLSIVGGLAGYGESSTISNAYVTGSVTGDSYIGGLVGFSTQSSTISNAFSAVSVTGNFDYLGGLVGANRGSSIDNAYATGNVSGSIYSDYVGGLVGWNYSSSSISNTFSTGSVTGRAASEYIGGLVGRNVSSTITGSFWNTETSGQVVGIGWDSSGQTITGLTTADMLNAASFGGFDLTSVWTIREGKTSPYLQALDRHSVLMSDGEAYLSVQTIEQLQAISNDLSANYVLFNDIDASETASWNSGAGFDPLGDIGAKFTGNFDGLGYVISDLTIDRSSESYVGLFGYASGAAIRNVGLEDVSVTGISIVGGLTGYNESSTITNAYVTGSVTGNTYVGGLVGSSTSSSTISNAFAAVSVTGYFDSIGGLVGANFSSRIDNAYATGSVTGHDQVGGLVGRNTLSSAISNTFSTGSVTGSSFVGGLVGYDSSSTITNSFWNTETSGQSIGIGSVSGQTITGLTTAEMLKAASFGGLDFTSVWTIREGEASPYLQALDRHSVLLSDGEAYLSVQTLAQLQAISNDLSGNYVLFNDIGASETASWNSGAGFDPLGDASTKFTGNFDGLGHVISDLTIDRSSKSYVGLFGYTSGAAIRNVGLEGVSVTGGAYIGGLIGYNSSSPVSNAYVMGNVRGGAYVGGLTGYNGSSAISNAYAIGSVTGSSNVGGLVGYNRLSTISNAYALNSVTGSSSYVGGLAGYNDASVISDAYAAGSVSGDIYVGGLVGVNVSSTVGDAYATGSVAGNSYTGGLVGYNTFSSAIANAYATGSVTGSTYVGGLVGWNLSSTITGSFWNTETSGQAVGMGRDSSSQTVTGLTTAEMLKAASFGGFDFASVWTIRQGETSPYLQALDRHSVLMSDGEAYLSVQTIEQLQAISNDLSGNYVLFNDIDASDTSGWNSGAGFDPLGEGSTPFTGNFDGLGHVVTDLTIYRPSENFVGLFGAVSGAAIRNAGLEGGSVTGSWYVGGLAGMSSSSAITSAYATDDVTGNASVGGLVGFSGSSTIANAYATGNVTGLSFIGGLAGYNYDTSTISNAYASGSVTGSNYVGGLVGVNDGSAISNAYALGSVTGNVFVGGLAGLNNESTITASFWNTETSGQISGTGVDYNSQTVTGLTTAEMQDPFTFIDAGWDFSNLWGTPKAGGAPQLRALTSSASLYTYYVRLSGDLTRTYGGTLSASGIALDGIGTSNVTLDWGSAITSTTNVGSYGYGDADVLALSYATGTAADYYLDYGTDGLTINPASITVSISDLTKTYDGTTAASGTAIVVAGQLFGTDSLSGGSFAFTDRDAGTGKTITVSGVTVDDGNGGGNYTVTYADNINSTIDRAVISAITGITAGNKTYDGTRTATLDTSGAGFSGMISGDSLTVASAAGAFADKNAGTGKTVTITGLSLGGADAGNYTLADTTAVTTADIARAVISAITGITAGNKTYDGTRAATLDTSGAAFSGIVSGDSLTVASSTGAFADKNAGTGKTVTITGLSLGGADAGNYTLADTTAVTTADIARAVISAITGITAGNKTYDGTRAATLDTSGAGFSGMISGDSLTVASSTGAFADKNAGTGKTVNISGLTLGGADAGNYALADTTATTTADILAKALTLSGFTVADKIYDGTTAATISNLGTLSGVVSGDTVGTDMSGATALFADKNAGTGKTVTLNGVTLSGADAGNYTITGTATTTADIAKAVISAITGIAARDKIYDGTTVAALDLSGAGFLGMISGDSLTVASANGAFDNAFPGYDKSVSITALALGGLDAGNYVLAGTTSEASADVIAGDIAPFLPDLIEKARYKGFDGPTVYLLDSGPELIEISRQSTIGIPYISWAAGSSCRGRTAIVAAGRQGRRSTCP